MSIASKLASDGHSSLEHTIHTTKNIIDYLEELKKDNPDIDIGVIVNAFDNKMKAIGYLKIGNNKEKKEYFEKLENLTPRGSTNISGAFEAIKEDEIYKITETIRKKNPDFLTIIIPRHPNRNQFFSNQNNKNIVFRSSKGKIKKDTSIYLVDTYGELHIFYSIADFIFIGGSFVDHGGQNPIEAAFYGKIINHGKNIQNFTDVYAVLSQMNITNQVNNSNQLRHYIVSNYSKKTKTSKALNLRKLQSEGRSAMKNVITIIDQYLPKNK